MKQLKFTILLTLLICLVDAKSFAYTAEIDGIYYDFGSTEATVTYYEYGSGNVNAYSGNVVIPENVVYNETSYSVTSIGFAAFSYCSGITSLTIPNSVTSIEALAFWKCSNLKSLTISSSLTIIGNSAFDGCHPIIYVSVTDLSAFCSNKVLGLLPSEYSWNVHLLDKDGIEIKDYVIPNDVTSIGSSAFKHCSGLSSITIPKSVANIGDHAFMGCI